MSLTLDIDQITLEFYNEGFREHLQTYDLSEDHSYYTAFSLDAIEMCEQEEDRNPIIIHANGLPVGFFVLHGYNGVKNYTNNENALLLRAYSVRTSFQGKGIAKKSMQILPAFIKEHFRDANEVILAVNKRNVTAQSLYKKSGFNDKGIRVMGIKGELFVYHLAL
ncbi:GNAT family N-acetyltransferase [Bacillus suaedaesalsae]|uniref:GNAT family N-acetyltransferase n=1 Tax=Bacillus suaedaesalsae TaxID=2810349 RepID=A0ABS2DJL1_9BACI|nr:GNAT family N-acetyltransferase [Bacillus suaedaesalsae]MBM6618571.1 GNAT family N-acetyltransferase [Bacillus suaedaesalsae]